jgi:hypothetical protein
LRGWWVGVSIATHILLWSIARATEISQTKILTSQVRNAWQFGKFVVVLFFTASTATTLVTFTALICSLATFNLVKTEASIDHALIMMSKTFLARIAIVVVSASF